MSDEMDMNLEENSPEESTGVSTINIEDEMKNSYIEYAMSVIVGRALPDVRDGLKPVHRRILYSMYNSGFTANRPYKKCARIVGDVLGRYHPHGDSAVYDSLVRMAQDFSLRYPLIDGQGNYGSIDGDNAAAMRYTEARMARISMYLLQDIEKETVNFGPNFDESLEEPTVLPTRLPNLLLNGTSGIAVGMATNIPPHNLTELMNGINAYIDNPDITVYELMDYIKGPDFPTAGIICGNAGITQAYETGRGSVVMRARTTVEESKKANKKAIIVHEIPYQVNKANLIIKIAELVNEKKIPGIADLRDESDRRGMRIYIELKRDAVPDIVLNQLYKHTQMQMSFGVNMVALVGGIPRLLNLKQIISHYVEHRREVITRRTEFELKNAKDRLHILEGLKIALDNIDAVIALIRASSDTETARSGLMEKFGLSEKQANAILDMRLQRLTGLEREKLEQEYQELLLRIQDLEDILANVARVYSIIKEEHIEIRDRFGDARRTEIGGAVDAMDIEDLIPRQNVALVFTQKGFVKRMPLSVFRSQARGGRGVSGMSTRDEDIIDKLLVPNTHDYLLCFTSMGRVFKIKVYQIPEAGRQSKGVSISHFLQMEEGEKLTTAIPVKDFDLDDEFLFMTTEKGTVKKTPISAYKHFKNRPIIAIDLDKGDKLRWVSHTNGKQDIVLVTSAGMVIRFNEGQVRSMGRTARGVRGIRIKPSDALVRMDVIDSEEENQHLLILTLKGYGKNIRIGEFRCQARGGIGVKSLKFRKTIKGDHVTDAIITPKDNEVMIISKNGTVCRQKISSISTQKRESQGVKVVKLDDSDEVMSMAKVIEDNEEELNQLEAAASENEALQAATEVNVSRLPEDDSDDERLVSDSDDDDSDEQMSLI